MRVPGEGCEECKELFSKVINFKSEEKRANFNDRPMEFPGFYKSLDFSKEHVKDIMIIGEAAGPQIATNINCTYSLSNLEIDNNGKILTDDVYEKLKQGSKNLKKKFDLMEINGKKLEGLTLEEQIDKFLKNLNHNLWEILSRILPISLNVLKDEIYISDLVKCNAKGNNIWKNFQEKCFEKLLFHEIRIINPKLIIFLGNTAYNFLKKKLKKKFDFDTFCPTTSNGSDYINEKFLKEHPEYKAYLDYNFRKDKYLKRFYEDIVSFENKKINFADKKFIELKSEDKKKLIKNQKIPLNFPAFGTIKFKYDSQSSIIEIKFVKIFHNSNNNTRLWNVYRADYKDLL